MHLYQWGARGKSLGRILNWANNFAFMLYGWDAGVIGGILANPHFLNDIGNPTDSRYITWIAAGILLGDVVGLLCLSAVSFRIGRRTTIIVCCIVALVGVALQTATQSPIEILAGRVVLGLANGPLAATTPVYVQEASVVGSKRTFDTMVMVLWGIGGISAATWFDYAMLKAPNPGAWRGALAMQAVFLIIALVMVIGCPESPRWLFARNQDAQGTAALGRLLDAEAHGERLLSTRQEILHSIELEREQTRKLSVKTLFTGDGSPTKNVRRIWIAILVTLGSPLFGTSLITFYGQSLLQGVGLEGESITLALAAINTGVPVGMACSFYILPRVGRRPILRWGAASLTTLLCIYTGLANVPSPSPGVQWASVVVLVLFQLVNGLSWIWLAFLYAVEILPLQYRSQVQSSSNTVYWFLAFIAVYFGGQGAADPDVGAKVYITFCLTGAIVTVLAWVYVVETKDLTLEEIDLLWAEPEYIESRRAIASGAMGLEKKGLDAKEAATAEVGV